jgi:hypothetical protein
LLYFYVDNLCKTIRRTPCLEVTSVHLSVRDIDSTSKPLDGAFFLNLILEAFSKHYRKLVIFNHMAVTASGYCLLVIKILCPVVLLSEIPTLSLCAVSALTSLLLGAICYCNRQLAGGRRFPKPLVLVP